jgi:hypothetical protein
MEIIRNKFLTRIIGSDIELKLSTRKYDDIVGIVDGVLPVQITTILEDEDIVTLNGNIIGLKDLYEFSDMNNILYRSSIFNASLKEEKEDAIYNITARRLNTLLNQLSGKPMQEAWLKSGMYMSRDILISPYNSGGDRGYRKYTPSELSAISSIRNDAWNTTPFELMNSELLSNLCRVIVNRYNNLISFYSFFDKNGNSYEFEKLSVAEVQQLILNKFSLQTFAEDIKKYSNKIHSIADIYKNTQAWRRYQSGILEMLKNGQKTLVDISDLIEKDLYIEMKKLGKSILEIRKFYQLTTSKIMN